MMDDQARRVLDALAALVPDVDSSADDAAWLAGFRYQTALLREFGGTAVPLASVTLRALAGVPTRIYRPRDDGAPILFHIHGGGGVAGALDIHDPALRLLAARTGWTVVAPEYRLAPEHHFPAQIDDSYAALTALHSDAPDRRIVVSGDSIGGTIAIAMAIQARDRAGPSIAGQLLFYPNTDLRRGADYPSRATEDGNIIAVADLERQIGLYLEREEDRTDPLASPLLAQLSGLPPTLVITGECDPLRDEGEAFADRLMDAGVSVEQHRVPGMIHAFLQMRGQIDAVDHVLRTVSDWLETH